MYRSIAVASLLPHYEYSVEPAEDLDVWYQHPGDVVLHLIEGRLAVERVGLPTDRRTPETAGANQILGTVAPGLGALAAQSTDTARSRS